jgi:hypothetical protein
MRYLILALIALIPSFLAHAQEAPIVRVEVTPDTVAVGESIELKVTVLVPTWFTKPPVYPNFELANAITRLPPDSSYSYRERVGNDSWPAIVRSYEVLPLLGANYRLNGQTMSVTYANPGSAALSVEVAVPEVSFRASVPAGAESLDPYIAGRRLKLSIDVEGDINDLDVGDALVLNYTAELDGLPAIFLPPLAPEFMFDGVSVYRDAATLEDGSPARRSEKLTLVFESGGNFSVPDTELAFWNIDTQSIENAVADGFTIAVKGPVAALEATQQPASRHIIWVAIAAGLGLAAIVVYSCGPAWKARRSAKLEARKRSEAYAFGAVQAALRTNDAAAAYRAILTWLGRLEPGLSMRQLAREYGDAPLSAALDALSESIYAGTGYPVEAQRITSGLAQARRRYLNRFAVPAESHLPELNP